jgi:hypothetical protein
LLLGTGPGLTIECSVLKSCSIPTSSTHAWAHGLCAGQWKCINLLILHCNSIFSEIVLNKLLKLRIF